MGENLNLQAAPDAAEPPPGQPPKLLKQLAWIVRLRWVAGAGVVGGGILDQFWLHAYHANGWRIAAVGLVILGSNVLFRALVQKARRRDNAPPPGRLYGLAWAQILVDLLCLTALTALTGGYASPLHGFFVFHMVFASLLLPRMMAFAAALVAIVMVEGTLAIVAETSPHVPTFAKVTPELAWIVTLLVTVYLASQLAESIRRQARRLAGQNRRIRAMSQRLKQHQQALAHQEKMIAMGHLASGVAHEIANPLASMDGLLQLLERRPEKISPENLARLRDQIARINRIVRQLTTFAHPGEDQWQQTSLNDLVLRVLEVLDFDPRMKQLVLERSLDPRLPKLRLQPAAIEQVILNIIVNALDAMQGPLNTGEAKLGLRTELAGSEVRLTISDNGCGIPPELMERIFDPFFTTKPVGKGTGLGLAISYSLIRKHAGDIIVNSTPGRGSVFTIRLPIAPQSREEGPGRFVTPEKLVAK